MTSITNLEKQISILDVGYSCLAWTKKKLLSIRMKIPAKSKFTIRQPENWFFFCFRNKFTKSLAVDEKANCCLGYNWICLNFWQFGPRWNLSEPGKMICLPGKEIESYLYWISKLKKQSGDQFWFNWTTKFSYKIKTPTRFMLVALFF